MPIYNETITDNEIIDLITPFVKKVYLIGCGACENESLALLNDYPITVNIEAGKEAPYATIMELDRIRSILEGQNVQVETKYFNDINGFVCMKNAENNPYDVSPTVLPDVIFALCCDAGFNAIQDELPNTKVIKITRSKGMLYYSYSDKTGNRVVDKSQSGVIPIKR